MGFHPYEWWHPMSLHSYVAYEWFHSHGSSFSIHMGLHLAFIWVFVRMWRMMASHGSSFVSGLRMILFHGSSQPIFSLAHDLWLSNVTCVIDSCHKYDWVMSHIYARVISSRLVFTTHVYAEQDSANAWYNSCVRVTWFMHMCDSDSCVCLTETYSYVWNDLSSYMWHDSSSYMMYRASTQLMV